MPNCFFSKGSLIRPFTDPLNSSCQPSYSELSNVLPYILGRLRGPFRINVRVDVLRHGCTVGIVVVSYVVVGVITREPSFIYFAYLYC